MATLDELAGGRAVLGIGAGASGFAALGIARRQPATAIREAVSLIRRLWAGETVTQAGRVVQFNGGHLDFQARPTIPILVAGRGPAHPRAGGRDRRRRHHRRAAVASHLRLRPSACPRPARHEPGASSTASRRSCGPTPRLTPSRRRPGTLSGRSWSGVLLTSREVLGDLGVTLPDDLARALVGVDYGQAEAVARIAAQLPEDVLAHFSLAGDGRRCLEGAWRGLPARERRTWPWCRGSSPARRSSSSSSLCPRGHRTLPWRGGDVQRGAPIGRGKPALVSVQPIGRALGELAARAPDHPALTHEGRTLTRRELERRTNRLARAYGRLGVTQDRFVTIGLPNGIEFFEAMSGRLEVRARRPSPSRPGCPARAAGHPRARRPSLAVGTPEGEAVAARSCRPGSSRTLRSPTPPCRTAWRRH